MKYQLVMFCFIVMLYVTIALNKEDEKKFAERCKETLNATAEEMKVLEEIQAIPRNKQEFCILACFYKASGTMNSNNTIIYEKVILEIEPVKKTNKDVYDKLDKIFKECTEIIIPVEDECDSLQKYLECVIKKAKEVAE